MKLVGILDDEKNWGKRVFGYKVIGPKEVKNIDLYAILITSMNNKTSGLPVGLHLDWIGDGFSGSQFPYIGCIYNWDALEKLGS